MCIYERNNLVRVLYAPCLIKSLLKLSYCHRLNINHVICVEDVQTGA